MELYTDRCGEVILDYGCGPGNDMMGFSLFSNACKVIGLDVSKKSLEMAKHRLELHRIDPSKVELINIRDSAPTISLADDSVDYVHCCGVLHHVTDPSAVLKEFFRVLSPHSRANVMVYNYDSVWLHLYVAYEMQILGRKFSGVSIREAFSKSTDGEDCPIARCYKPAEFVSICESAGFDVDFVGGYLARTELDSLSRHARSALNDEKLDEEHKRFIGNLVFDRRHYPVHMGKYAGVGGVYRLRKS